MTDNHAMDSAVSDFSTIAPPPCARVETASQSTGGMERRRSSPTQKDASKAPREDHPNHAAIPSAQFLILFIILAAAAWVRFASLGHDSLGHDEAFRANWWHHGTLAQARRFPPLQFVLGWFTQHVFGRSEFILRFPYALAGTVSVLALYKLVRASGRARPAPDATNNADPGCNAQARRGHVPSETAPLSQGGSTGAFQAAALLAAAFAAGHPVLMAHSQQAKVFSLEVLATAVIAATAMNFCRSISKRDLLVFAGAAGIGLGFTFTASLSICAWIPVLGALWWRRRRSTVEKTDCPGPRIVILVLGALLILGFGWYVWFAGCPNRSTYVSYYDGLEKTWPTTYNPVSFGQWVLVSSYDVLRYVLGINHCWAPLNWFVASLTLLTMFAGIGSLWRSARELCVAWTILVLGAIAAGALRQWPYGGIRHVAFLVPLAIVLAGYGLADLYQKLGRSSASFLLIAACVLVPYARAVKAHVFSPSVSEHVRPVYEYIRAHRRPEDALFVYYAVAHAYEYYWHDDDMPALVQPGDDREHFDSFANRFDEWIRTHPRTWFIFTHNWKNEREQWLTHLLQSYDLVDRFETADASVHLFTLPSSDVTARANADSSAEP